MADLLNVISLGNIITIVLILIGGAITWGKFNGTIGRLEKDSITKEGAELLINEKINGKIEKLARIEDIINLSEKFDLKLDNIKESITKIEKSLNKR